LFAGVQKFDRRRAIAMVLNSNTDVVQDFSGNDAVLVLPEDALQMLGGTGHRPRGFTESGLECLRGVSETFRRFSNFVEPGIETGPIERCWPDHHQSVQATVGAANQAGEDRAGGLFGPGRQRELGNHRVQPVEELEVSPGPQCPGQPVVGETVIGV
jgi:hypothetical protein